MLSGLFGGKELDDFAMKLAAELDKRVPAAKEPKAEKIERALDHVEASAKALVREHGMNVIKRIRVSKAFQDRLAEMGYADEFVKAATLRFAQALSDK